MSSPGTQQEGERQPAIELSADLQAACFARLPWVEQAVTVGC